MNALNVPKPILGLIYSFGSKKDYLSSILVCKVWSKIKASVNKYVIEYIWDKVFLHQNTWWLCRNALCDLTCKSVIITMMRISDVKIVCGFKNLKRLHLESRLNNETTKLISQLHRLESIGLCSTMIINDEWMEGNLFRETLKELVLTNCMIDSLGWVAMVPNLESLVIDSCIVPKRCFCDGTFNSRKLVKLEISVDDYYRHNRLVENEVNNDVFEQIGKMEQLEELVFRSNYVLNIKLGGMKSLKKLVLNCVAVEEISGLTELVNLRELKIYGGCYINDDVLLYWKEIVGLKTLILCGCACVTDIGLAHLSVGLFELEELDLSFCNKITDAGLSCLGGMRQLHTVNLSHCRGITDEGVLSLRKLGKNVVVEEIIFVDEDEWDRDYGEG